MNVRFSASKSSQRMDFYRFDFTPTLPSPASASLRERGPKRSILAYVNRYVPPTPSPAAKTPPSRRSVRRGGQSHQRGIRASPSGSLSRSEDAPVRGVAYAG